MYGTHFPFLAEVSTLALTQSRILSSSDFLFVQLSMKLLLVSPRDLLLYWLPISVVFVTCDEVVVLAVEWMLL